MRIALIDDDVTILQHLSALISQELSSFGGLTHQIHTYTSGESFLSEWHPGCFDLIILDIYMKEEGLLGIDVAHKIRETDHSVSLAFCTTSNEFAAESYEVEAKFYLQKPISELGVKKMLKRMNLEDMELNRIITLPNGKAIRLRSILYTEYSNHNITIYFKDKTNYRFRFSQKEMEDILMPYGYFCTPNKGLIVNFHEVTRINEELLILTNGENLPVSRRKLKEIKDAYTKFCFMKMRKEVAD